jgi:hypothetical protein
MMLLMMLLRMLFFCFSIRYATFVEVYISLLYKINASCSKCKYCCTAFRIRITKLFTAMQLLQLQQYMQRDDDDNDDDDNDDDDNDDEDDGDENCEWWFKLQSVWSADLAIKHVVGSEYVFC